MADPESRAVRLLAEYYEMPLAETAIAFSLTLAAFRQAAAEFGIPEHPGGKCPRSGLPVHAAGRARDRAG